MLIDSTFVTENASFFKMVIDLQAIYNVRVKTWKNATNDNPAGRFYLNGKHFEIHPTSTLRCYRVISTLGNESLNCELTYPELMYLLDCEYIGQEKRGLACRSEMVNM
jgi:hypothetical protein